MMPKWPGASELWMKRMISSLSGHIVAIACGKAEKVFYDNSNIPIINLDWPKGTRISDKKERLTARLKGYKERYAEKRILKTIKRYKPDIVLSHYLNFSAKYNNLWSNIDQKIYVYCHGYDVSWNQRRADNPEIMVHSEDYKASVLEAAKNVTFIANSKSTEKKLTSIGVSKSVIITNEIGVPVCKAFPKKELSRNYVNVLYLGRLVDCKGPDLTIRAFELARQHGLSGNLIIAGNGPLRTTCELLKARSTYKENIEIIGTVNEQEGELLRAQSDIFTAHNCTGPVTGQTEAHGISILEAMSSGLPVVTGYSGGVADIVVDGKTGILFKPDDVDAHSEALLKLATHSSLRKDMGYAGWMHANNNYNINNLSESLLKILSK